MKDLDKPIVWFSEVGRDDLSLVGGKGANLGELARAGIPIPPGFIVTTQAYYRFLEESGLAEKFQTLLTQLDPNDSRKLYEISKEIKELIQATEMPEGIAQGIAQTYSKLGGLVAVRSSATAEDLPEASFAGQQTTFLNVQGEEKVVQAVKQCWASLYEPRAIFYRAEQNLDNLRAGIAVPVQRMIQSEASGVMFTVEPVTNEPKIAIEAIYGLGEAIVSGGIIPDMYVVDKESLAILDKKITRQEWKLVRRDEITTNLEEANIKVPVPEEEQERQKLSDEEITQLARLGLKIEGLYQFPQDIEWGRGEGKLYIVQTRHVTTLAPKKEEEEIKAQAFLSGSPASPGASAGPVKIVKDASFIDKVKEGDVLVTDMTTPDFVPAMKRATAIVTNRGGKTCHAAIVSRELGIPCVVGTNNATTLLKDAQIITVDGSKGKVYEGEVAELKKIFPAAIRKEKIQTKTKVYVNLAEPEAAERAAQRDVDGVGLLRAEFMIAQIGEHPNLMLREGRGGEFVERLVQGLESFAYSFYPRPVVYRTTDFKTNEYRNLKGGDEFESAEENPMIGYRGCSRYVRDIQAFKLELEAIKKVRENYDNLWVMLPFVRTVKELTQTKSILVEEGLVSSDKFKLWMMAEVPSNVFLIDQFLDEGIDGISIGSNDLTQLVLGIDRDNSGLAEEFDELNEAVLIALEKLIKATVGRGATCSICGQAPSFYPEFTEKLVEWGITSVSVNPDMIEQTRELISEVEKRLRR